MGPGFIFAKKKRLQADAHSPSISNFLLLWANDAIVYADIVDQAGEAKQLFASPA